MHVRIEERLASTAPDLDSWSRNQNSTLLDASNIGITPSYFRKFGLRNSMGFGGLGVQCGWANEFSRCYRLQRSPGSTVDLYCSRETRRIQLAVLGFSTSTVTRTSKKRWSKVHHFLFRERLLSGWEGWLGCIQELLLSNASFTAG